MRSALLILSLVACSSSSLPPSAAPSASIAQFVPVGTTSVAAWRPTDFPQLAFFDRANQETFVCWRGLEERLAVGYQVFIAPGSSFSILEGDLPRNEVEKCVDDVLLYNQLSTNDVHRDGELTVFETTFGTVYAAWRGRYIVFGARDAVTKALSATASPTWVEAVAELPGKDGFSSSAVVAIGTDRMFANLLGVPTIRWKLVMELPAQGWPARELIKDGADALEKFGEEQARIARRKEQGLSPTEPAVAPQPAPRDPVFAGRVELRYATADEATRAGHALAQGAFAFELEENLATSLARLPQLVSRATLVIRFDQKSFAGVELEKLQAWIARVQAAAALR